MIRIFYASNGTVKRMFDGNAPESMPDCARIDVTSEADIARLKSALNKHYIVTVSGGTFSIVEPMEELKEKAYAELWRNYKSHQTKYVDAEDLTLATLCASQGSTKGIAIQSWVMGLWAQYYTVKDTMAAAETADVLAGITRTADAYGAPPYTIRELNTEAAAYMAGTQETGNESNV